MAKCLFACDELCGFVLACALVRPGGLTDLGSSSVRKKLKDKAFARGVNRDHIAQGVAELGVSLDDHVAFVIDALRRISGDLGFS
jgi:predicted hydrolase (HD superfamily)